MEFLGYVIGLPISFFVLWVSLSLLKVKMSRWDIGTVTVISTVTSWAPFIGFVSIPLLVYLVKKFGAVSWGKAWQVFGVMLLLTLLLFFVPVFIFHSVTHG